MIQLNNRNCEWEKGMTVRSLLDKKNYVFPKIIVKINGLMIDEDNWSDTTINDGDDVKAIHVFAGG